MKTNKDKIKYLREYVDICKELDEVREYYKSKTYHVAAQVLTDMPRGSGFAHDVVGSKLAKLDSIDEMVDKRLRKLEPKRLEIEAIIDRLEESIHRRLMHMRYIQGLTFEEISYRMSYCWRQVHRVHSTALNKVEV